MNKTLYTKKESFGVTWEKLGILALLCMAAFLYPSSWRKTVSVLFLLIFLGCLAWELWQTREVLQRRKKHQMCLTTQTPQKGRIVDCVGTKNFWILRGLNMAYQYYLVVEICPQGSEAPVTIRSDAYTWPVYRALSSAEVDVYTSDTESGYTLDGFQYKTDKSEPDILPESVWKALPAPDVDPGAWIIVALFAVALLAYWYFIVLS